MSGKRDTAIPDDLRDWVKETLDNALAELGRRGLFQSVVIEAKPAWVLPRQLLIGKVRAQEHGDSFDWFICGDAPLDLVHSSNASTPREAARHFALKWQLQAARQRNGDPGLVEKAEALYELVEEDTFWLKD